MFPKSIHYYKHKIFVAAENEHSCLCWSTDMDVIGVEQESLCVMDSDSVFTWICKQRKHSWTELLFCLITHRVQNVATERRQLSIQTLKDHKSDLDRSQGLEKMFLLSKKYNNLLLLEDLCDVVFIFCIQMCEDKEMSQGGEGNVYQWIAAVKILSAIKEGDLRFSAFYWFYCTKETGVSKFVLESCKFISWNTEVMWEILIFILPK